MNTFVGYYTVVNARDTFVGFVYTMVQTIVYFHVLQALIYLSYATNL